MVNENRNDLNSTVTDTGAVAVWCDLNFNFRIILNLRFREHFDATAETQNCSEKLIRKLGKSFEIASSLLKWLHLGGFSTNYRV
jgi:hypothetical protein